MRCRLASLLLAGFLAVGCQGVLPLVPSPQAQMEPATPTPAAQSLWGGEDTFSIVFSEFKVLEDGRSYDAFRNLYLATWSGRERKQLTFYRGREAGEGVFEFDVSPDGKRIAFMGATGAGTGLYVMDMDSRAVTRLLEDDSGWLMRGLSWSPNSQKIAFLHYQGPYIGRSPQVLKVINADGSGLIVVSPPVHSRRPVWFPDSMHLAFTAGSALARPYPPPSYVASLAGGEPRLIQKDLLLEAWSPNGQKMLWSDVRPLSKSPPSGATNRRMLWVSGPDGVDPRPLTSEEEFVGAYAWAPDSRSLAYVTPNPDPTAACCFQGATLWVADAGSGQRQRLNVFPETRVERMEWAPDGAAIYLLVPRDYVYDLWATSSLGGVPRKIVEGVFDYRILPGERR